jgi:polar amino acid transport system substrate-binding protein
MRHTLSFTLLWLMPALPAAATPMQLFTEENPPFTITTLNEKPTGYGIEVVTHIQERLDSNHPIGIVSWARAYKTISENSNVVVFTMARTPEREKLFQWVGPVVENHWVLIGKKSAGLSVPDLAAAKKLESIGVVRDYAWDKYLVNQGFTNIERTIDNLANVKKCHLERIQTYASSKLTYRTEIIKAGLDPNDFEVLLTFNTVQMFIAHSKDTDPTIVNRWQSAFDTLRKDGSLQKILHRWLPGTPLPPVAKPANF